VTATVEAPPAHCANCDAALSGPFCSRCGQRNANLGVSLRVLARDFADEYLSIDSRLFRSGFALLFRPGFLTRQYLIGRRERFVRPLRLYLVTSLLFFFALSTVARPALRAELDTPDASIRELIVGSAGSDADAAEPTQSAAMTDGVSGWKAAAMQRVEHLGGMSPQQLVEALASGLERQLPRTMFVLLPAFALILKVLYVRRGWFYAEHFVFALHFHAFAFTVFLLLLILPGGWWTRLLMLWGVLYLFLAMHRVYAQSVWRTAVKFTVLTSVYWMLLLVGFIASLAVTLLLV
jgi:hypothetical protein